MYFTLGNTLNQPQMPTVSHPYFSRALEYSEERFCPFILFPVRKCHGANPASSTFYSEILSDCTAGITVAHHRKVFTL